MQLLYIRICDRAYENRACGLLKFDYFSNLALITFYSNMVRPQNFLSLLIIYLALQHCLQNPNTTFQYWDMSHKMAWYILVHMPYFRRPSHIWWHLYSTEYHTVNIRDHGGLGFLNSHSKISILLTNWLMPSAKHISKTTGLIF